MSVLTKKPPSQAEHGKLLQKKLSLMKCQHPGGGKLVKKECRNGAFQIVKQCVNCGETTEGPIRRSTVTNWEKLPVFDESLMGVYIRNRELFVELENKNQNIEWWKWYKNYLLSTEWGNKRLAALERDNYLCQGCLNRRASQVHHLTYENVGDELLFQLISLCDSCHEKCHAD